MNPLEQKPTPVSLAIEGINHAFGEGENQRQILFDNWLTVHEGEVVIMSGPSGSGKTTLLTLIGALRSIQEGEIHTLQTPLSFLSPSKQVRLRRKIGFIFQAHNLFESLSARQNVRMALELSDQPPAQWNSLADQILQDLGLGERLHYKPRKLSGGQRQRVAIARALVNRPKLILADEPTAALDKEMGTLILEKLKTLARENGSTILIVSHDARILAAADRIVNMVDGRIVNDYHVETTVFICDFIRRVEIFKAMSIDDLTNIAQKMQPEQFQEGETVFHEGEEGDKFYLIHSGRAQVIRQGAAGDEVLSTLGPEDGFGEVALLKEQPRSASIKVIEPLKVFSLNKRDFLEATQKHLSFKDQLSRSLLNRT